MEETTGKRCASVAAAGLAVAARVWLLATLAVTSALAQPPQGKTAGGYAPEGSCGDCHQQQAVAWQHSDHAWAMRPATADSVLGRFDDTEFRDGPVGARFYRHDDQYWVRIEGPEGAIDEYRVAYTFGHDPLQQYLVAFPGGRLQALTIAWDSRPQTAGGQRWFSLYPGRSFAPDDPLHWTGRYQNWNAMCADCHSTFLQRNYQADDDTFATTWAEQNVGCQGCHGPGQAHLDWAQGNDTAAREGGESRGLMLDYDALTAAQLVDRCGYCHSRREALKDGHHAQEPLLESALPATLRPDLYHPDGQIQGEVYVYGSFVQSKMARAGVGCLDCHDPHTAKVRIDGNGLCLQCHNPAPPSRFPQLTAGRYDDPAHHHHPLDSEGGQCVNCHMPASDYMVVDPRRDHSFRIPRPDLTLSSGSPNACNGCHQDRGADWAQAAIVGWRMSASGPPDHFATALNSFRQAEDDGFRRLAALIRDRQAPAIARATAAEHLGDYGAAASSPLLSGVLSGEPLVMAYAAGSMAQLPAVDRLSALRPLLTEGQPRAVRDQAVRALAGIEPEQVPEAMRGRLQALKQDYEQRMKSTAVLPGGRLNLAVFLQREQRFDEAVEQYQAALTLDPYFIPARINLASLLSRMGELAPAVNTLQAGLALPRLAASDRAHLAYLLALSLVERGDPEQALQWFTAAAEQGSANPRIAYNHALVLAQLDRPQAALAILEQALEQHPVDYGLLQALVYLHLQSGDRVQALHYAERLQQLYPDNPEVAELLRRLRSSR